MNSFVKIASFIGVAILSLTACAQKSVITENDLKPESQSFLKEYFPNNPVSYIILDSDKDYDVTLNTGIKVEFDRKGAWESVDCALSPVPNGIIPAKISNYISQKFPNQFVTEISKEFNGYDVELNNGLELEFSSDGEFKRIDD